jgi:peptide/nickel transport system substrate-binding protein/oligopeptide transport system substrate-binding protein
LTKPDANFTAILTHPALVPLERNVVSNLSRFLRRPVSNGAFKMADTWSPGSPVVLEANLDYRDPPAIDGIRFNIYDDPTASYKDLVAGRIDVSEVPALAIDDAANRFGTRGFKPFLSASYYAFNLDNKRFHNRRLRVAVSHAINRRHIARRIYQGTLSLPRGVVPSGIPGFSDDVCGKLCRYRPAAARRVVRQLPTRDRSLVVQTNSGDPYESVNKAIAKDLRRAGFTVSEQVFPFRHYLRLIASGRQDLYRLSWLAEYPDPDVFLHDLFSTAGSGNASGYSNKRVDALISDAMRTNKAKRRLRLYGKAERKIIHALPVVPIGDYETHWAARHSVHGLVFDDTGGFDASGVTIAHG